MPTARHLLLIGFDGPIQQHTLRGAVLYATGSLQRTSGPQQAIKGSIRHGARCERRWISPFCVGVSRILGEARGER